MNLAYQDAKKTLLVNQLEVNRQYKPTKGTLQIGEFDYKPEELYFLPNQVKDVGQILIYYINDNEYELENVDTEIKVVLTYSQILNILTLFYFDKYTDIEPDIYISDSNGQDFFYNKDLDFRGHIEMVMKYMIYNTLDQLEQQNRLNL
jgi:hypothetical protein